MSTPNTTNATNTPTESTDPRQLPFVFVDDDYAPFPEKELGQIAEHFELLASSWKAVTPAGERFKHEWLERAKTCRDAIKSHDAVRERCLLAELDRDGQRYANALVAVGSVQAQAERIVRAEKED